MIDPEVIMKPASLRWLRLMPAWKIPVLVMVLSVFSLAAHADADETYYYFKCTASIDKDLTYFFYWDVKKDGQARKVVEFSITGPATPSQVAAKAAAAINNKVGRNIAHDGEDGEIDLDLGWHPTEEDAGYQAQLGSFKSIGYLDGYFDFGSDLLTGNAYLTGPGSYAVADSSGHYASFQAPSGTSADSLAAGLAAAMSSSGFDAYADGSAVAFHEPAGQIEFTPVGPGLDYGLYPTPEPGTFAMFGTGILALSGIFRRRAQLPSTAVQSLGE
jgi:hypothetical protein